MGEVIILQSLIFNQERGKRKTIRDIGPCRRKQHFKIWLSSVANIDMKLFNRQPESTLLKVPNDQALGAQTVVLN